MKITDFYENEDETILVFTNGTETFKFWRFGDYFEWKLIEYKKETSGYSKEYLMILSTSFGEIDLVTKKYTRSIKIDDERKVKEESISVHHDKLNEYYFAPISEEITIDNYLNNQSMVYTNNHNRSYSADVRESNANIKRFIAYEEYYRNFLSEAFKERDIIYSRAKKRFIKSLDTKLNNANM